MTTIREYFDTDQKALNAQREWDLKSKDGKPISKGLSAIIHVLLGSTPTTEEAATWTEKDNKLFSKLKFKEHTALFELASEFIH